LKYLFFFSFTVDSDVFFLENALAMIELSEEFGVIQLATIVRKLIQDVDFTGWFSVKLFSGIRLLRATAESTNGLIIRTALRNQVEVTHIESDDGPDPLLGPGGGMM